MPTPHRPYRRPQRAVLYCFVVAAFVLLGGCGQQTDPALPQEGTVLATVAVNGLTGHYFNSEDFSGDPIIRIDQKIDFHWGRQPPERGDGRGAPPGRGLREPRPGQPPSTFLTADPYSVRWTGQVQVPSSDTYSFHLESAGMSRLSVNGVVVFDSWDGTVSASQQPVALEAGVKYDLVAEYISPTGSASHLQLEWENANLAREVVPSAALLATGSNVQDALAVLQNDPLFQASGITLEPELAAGSLSPVGMSLVAPSVLTEEQFVIAVIADGAVYRQFHITYNENQATIIDPEANRSHVIVDVSQLYDTNFEPVRSKTNEEGAKFFNSIEGYSQPESSSDSITTSGLDTPHCDLIPPPPACGNSECARYGQSYRAAGCELASKVVYEVVGFGGILGGAKQVGRALNLGWIFAKWWWKTGELGWELIDFSKNVINSAESWRNYTDCVQEHAARTNQTCSMLFHDPYSISVSGPLHGVIEGTFLVENMEFSQAHVEYDIRERPLLLGVWFLKGGKLRVGEQRKIEYRHQCGDFSYTKTSTLFLFHTADKPSSPIEVPVQVTCDSGIRVEAYYFEGSSKTSEGELVSGEVELITGIVRNDRWRRGVKWTIQSGGGSFGQDKYGRWYYRAPLQNPEPEGLVEVKATSLSDPGQYDIITFHVQPISVDAYVHYGNRKHKDWDVASGGATLLNGRTLNDAPQKGVTWEIPSGLGGLSQDQYGRWVYSAPLRNPSPERAVEVVARSVSDPSKTDTITFHVQAIEVDVKISRGAFSWQSLSAYPGQVVSLTGWTSNDASRQGVSWLLEGPGTLSNEMTTSVTYQAPALACHTTTPTVVESWITGRSRADDGKSDRFKVTTESNRCP